MIIIEPGHKYDLAPLDDGVYQTIEFVKRVGKKFPFNAGQVHGGTNCQEVLRVLIDRSEFLQSQDPCAETECIVASLRSALLLFELRAARRHKRHLELESTDRLVCGPVCDRCGHYGCKEHVKI